MTNDVMDLSYKPDAQDKIVAMIVVGLSVFVWLLLWQNFHETLKLKVALGLFLAGAAGVSIGLFAGLYGRFVRAVAGAAFSIFGILLGLETIRLVYILVTSWF